MRANVCVNSVNRISWLQGEFHSVFQSDTALIGYLRWNGISHSANEGMHQCRTINRLVTGVHSCQDVRNSKILQITAIHIKRCHNVFHIRSIGLYIHVLNVYRNKRLYRKPSN